MLITPKDIRDWTMFNDVRRRTNFQLEYDIVLAEQEAFSYVGHKFTDAKYTPLPMEIKVILIKLAEYTALVNGDESIIKGYKSINLAGELQYTFSDGEPINKTKILESLRVYIGTGDISNTGETKVKLRMRFL